MRWGSFIFGLLFLLFALFGGFISLLIFILPAIVLLLIGLGESESEKIQKEQFKETRRLRSEVQSLKNDDVNKEQSKEIQRLKKEIDELKGLKKHEEKNDDEDVTWSCDFCNKEFNTKKEAEAHEKTCKKHKK